MAVIHNPMAPTAMVNGVVDVEQVKEDVDETISLLHDRLREINTEAPCVTPHFF